MRNIQYNIFEVTLRITCILLEVKGPHISQVAAFTCKIETCIRDLGRRIFTDNVIVLCHDVAEEMSVFSHFYKSTFGDVLIRDSLRIVAHYETSCEKLLDNMIRGDSHQIEIK